MTAARKSSSTAAASSRSRATAGAERRSSELGRRGGRRRRRWYREGLWRFSSAETWGRAARRGAGDVRRRHGGRDGEGPVFVWFSGKLNNETVFLLEREGGLISPWSCPFGGVLALITGGI